MAHVNSEVRAGEHWDAYWSTRPIPILEASKSSLQQMLRRAERVRPADAAAVVLADPLLTLQALRYVGQRQRSSLAAEVVSIESIVMLMGTMPFLERFCSLPTVESMLLPHAPDAYTSFLQELFLSRFSARLASIYADWRYDARNEEVVTAAILSRCQALLYLLGSKQDQPLTETGAEQCQFLVRFKIPAAVVQLLEKVDDLPPRAMLQQAVLRLVDAFQYGWWQAAVQRELLEIARILELETAAVWQGLCRVALSFARDSTRHLQMVQPARWLPMLPGDWPLPEIKPAQVVDRQPVLIRPDSLQQHMQALHLAGKQGRPAKEIMSLTMTALAKGLGMQRIVFAVQTPGQAELCVRYVLGVPADHALRQLTISLDQTHFFAKLMEKPQGLWLNERNAAQFVPHMPAEFRSCYAAEQFCVMSIFVGNKPLGLMLSDRTEADSLTEFHYQHFKQICLLAMQALARSAGH